MKHFILATLLFFTSNVYSAHQLKMISPGMPGGPIDITLNLYQSCFEEKQIKIIKDFRPGAEGYIALQTLLLSTNTDSLTHVLLGSFGINMLGKFPNIDVTKDILPLVYLNKLDIVFYVRSDRYKEISDLLSMSKKRQINFGAHSVSTKYFGEKLFDKAGVRYTYIPYKGTAGMIVDILNNDLDVAVDLYQAVYGFAKEGKITILASTMSANEAKKLGHENVDKYASELKNVSLGLILSVLPNTNSKVSENIIQAVQTCNKDPAVQEKLRAMNSAPVFLTSKEIQDIVYKIQNQIK